VYILDRDTLHRLRKELRDLDDAMNTAERWIRKNGIGLVDFRLYRGTRKPSSLEILKAAIRRTVLINRNISQEIDSPDFLAVLKEMLARQRAGVSLAEEELPFNTPDDVSINKEMFKKLIEMVEVIRSDNEEKRSEIQKLEERIERFTEKGPKMIESVNDRDSAELDKSLEQMIDAVDDME